MMGLSGRIRDAGLTALTLFTSGGTLICCALPAMLVALGFGSVVAALVGNVPWLVAVSRHKQWVFAVAAILLILGGWLIYRNQRNCPTDPRLGRLCSRIDTWNRRIYWLSVGLWAIGFFAAYLLLPVSRFLDFA